MADTKLTALSEISVPALEDLLYTVDDPSGTPVSNRITAARLFGAMQAGVSQLRLTLASGVSVTPTNQIGKSTLYLTPHTGQAIAIYDGTRWKRYSTAEISLALSGLTNAKNYDVFVYDNAGTLTLELSAAWTNDTTRADALTTQDGVYVKSGATTRLHVGTIRTTNTTTTEDALAHRYVWNRFNQAPRPLTFSDFTDSWSYTTDTIRQANATAANRVEYVTGDAATLVDAIVHGIAFLTANSATAAKVGVGVDSTTAFSGLIQGGYNQNANGVYAPVFGRYIGAPGLGYHALNMCEKGADGTCLFLGDNGGDSQLSGIYATVWA